MIVILMDLLKISNPEVNKSEKMMNGNIDKDNLFRYL